MGSVPTPPVPAPPPRMPVPNDAAAQDAQKRAQDQLLAQQGPAATNLSGSNNNNAGVGTVLGK